jgi:hypothetical protein
VFSGPILPKSMKEAHPNNAKMLCQVSCPKTVILNPPLLKEGLAWKMKERREGDIRTHYLHWLYSTDCTRGVRVRVRAWYVRKMYDVQYVQTSLSCKYWTFIIFLYAPISTHRSVQFWRNIMEIFITILNFKAGELCFNFWLSSSILIVILFSHCTTIIYHINCFL